MVMFSEAFQELRVIGKEHKVLIFVSLLQLFIPKDGYRRHLQSKLLCLLHYIKLTLLSCTQRPPIPKSSIASSNSSKRKFESPSLDPESYKSIKLSTSDDRARGVTIEEERQAGGEEDSFAPGGDANYFTEEDEDGRF